jgi:uncharacterized repeat protein (TIGR03806 family)
MPGEARAEIETGLKFVSITEGDDGALYFVRFAPGNRGGGVYRLAEAEPPAVMGDPFPTLLSETGCVVPDEPTVPSPELVAYRPIAELWSDGADKDRYFSVPEGATVDVDENGDFLFPVGSVLVKHFRFADRYHETRLLMHTADGWNGYSYARNEEQTDAELLSSGRSTTLPNGVRWLYPSRAQCFECHTEVAGRSLGLEVPQLDHALVDGDGHTQLEALLDRELLSGDLGALDRAAEPRLVDPRDDRGDATDRVRSYLHGNCAMCHQPDGPGRGGLDLRISATWDETGLCDGEPERRLWGFGDRDEQRILRPGRPDDSILYLRMISPTLFRMPPIGSSVPDAEAGALVRAWITELDDCTP